MCVYKKKKGNLLLKEKAEGSKLRDERQIYRRRGDKYWTFQKIDKVD